MEKNYVGQFIRFCVLSQYFNLRVQLLSGARGVNFDMDLIWVLTLCVLARKAQARLCDEHQNLTCWLNRLLYLFKHLRSMKLNFNLILFRQKIAWSWMHKINRENKAIIGKIGQISQSQETYFSVSDIKSLSKFGKIFIDVYSLQATPISCQSLV